MRRTLGIVAATIVAAIALAAAALFWFLSGDGVRAAIEQQAGAWLGQPVSIASARASLWPQVAVRLGDVRIGDPVRIRLGEVDVAASPMALLSRRVEEAELRIRNSRLDLPLSIAQTKDRSVPAEDSARADGGESAFRIVSVNAIALENVTIVGRGRELRLSASSSLVESRLLLRELTAQSGATSLKATGTIALAPRLDADLQLTANRLDVDELLVLANAFLPTSAGSAAPATLPRLKASVAADTARAAGIDARRFVTTMMVDGDRAALSPLSFELFGGRYQGSVEARLGQRVNATVRAQLTDIDTAQVAAFGGAADTVTGRLSGEASVSGAGIDLATVLASARGNGRVTIVDGSIQRLGLLRSVVLFFGRPEANAPPSTDRFDRLDARFGLANGTLTASAFGLHSPDLDTAGTGSLNLNSQALDGRMDVTLSEAVSKQAGTDLRRYTREGNRIVLPVKFGGTLSMPSVTIDAAAALKRGLRNEAEERLKGIFDRFKLRGQ